MVFGIIFEDYVKYNDDKCLFFLVRYVNCYVLGFIFKIIIVIIGLDIGVIKFDKVCEIFGL